MVKMPHWPVPYSAQPAELCLERMRELMRRMGNPHLLLPPVVHVAGTNGKGSTIAFLKYILKDAGYRVHTYTSPHISRYNERISLNGKEIEDSVLFSSIESARLSAEDMGLTFFEGTTAAAFDAFARYEGDILLMETGMGGAFDATNIIDNPIATVITSIDYDHMEYLGSKLENIAEAKAGIMKKFSPCIIAPQYNEVLRILLENAIEKEIGAFVCGLDWGFREEKENFVFIDDKGEVDFPLPALLGHHQVINASLAIAVLQCLKNFEVTYGNILRGLKAVKWPARLQKINSSISAALPKGWELWVDGAHNPGGADALSKSLDMWEGKKIILINGRTKDRDIEAFLTPFVGKVENVLAVRVMSEPKSENPSKIRDVAAKIGFDESREFDEVADAILYCINHYKSENLIILVTGSLYLFSDVMKARLMG